MGGKIKEGFPALLFLLAIIILFSGEFGILTTPGIFAAIIGIICVFKYRFIAALIGVVAATSSFVGQYLTVYCSCCFAAALMFAFAGTLCLFNIVKTKPQWSLMLIPMMASLMLFSTSFLPQDNRAEIIKPEISSQTNVVSGAKLYISTSCPSCKKVIPYFISQDKEGKLWQPVIIPNSALLKGEKYLREQGYKGPIYSASSSPSKKTPCLQNGDQVDSGGGVVITKAKELFKKANS